MSLRVKFPDIYVVKAVFKIHDLLVYIQSIKSEQHLMNFTTPLAKDMIASVLWTVKWWCGGYW